MSAAHTLYVYYRIRPECRGDGALAWARLCAALGAGHCAPPRLLQRADEPLLWMEVYEAVAEPPAFLAWLERLAEDTGMTGLLAADARRHAECFRPVAAGPGAMAPCA